jgi:predicted  nucleic acid-binding Zn-ribbon protein
MTEKLQKIESAFSNVSSERDAFQKELNLANSDKDAISAELEQSRKTIQHLELQINSKSLAKQNSFDDKPVLKAKIPGKSEFVSSDVSLLLIVGIADEPKDQSKNHF